MSEDWPRGWYSNEPDQPGAAGQRAQPSFTTGSQGPGAAGASQSAWPAQPPSRSWTGGTGGSGFSGRRGWRRWLRPRRLLVILASLVALALVATVAVYFSVSSKLTHANALVPTSLTSAGTNWLITGSTGKLTSKQVVQLHTGYDFDSLSDTIMLLHLPSNGDQPVLVSIPRDSYVPIPGHGYNKINAAYAFGGARLLVQTMQDVTGLRIDHYMGIGYTGLVSVVNAVGGVTMCLPAPMVDRNAGLDLKKGCQTLNGTQALGYVRTRAFALGDLQRVQDQRILLKAILSKMTSAGTLANPFAIIPAANGAASAISVDQGTGLSQLVSVAFALRNPVTTTVPFGQFANTNVGSVVEWNPTAAKQFFNDLGHDQALPKSLITGSSVQGTV
jgi:LCP family protein required for cell wall assembly